MRLDDSDLDGDEDDNDEVTSDGDELGGGSDDDLGRQCYTHGVNDSPRG